MKKFLVVALVLVCASLLFGQVPSMRVGRLNNVRYCNYEGFTGATMGAKIASCIADLPATGGIADATGIEGSGTISTDIFNNITKPVVLKLGAGTYTVSATQTIETRKITVIGEGPAKTTLHCTIDADCFRITSNPWSVDQGGSFGNLTLLGQNTANADAVGLHISGIIAHRVHDLDVRDFDGTNSKGIWLDHGASFADTTNFVERTVTENVHYDYNRIGLFMSMQAAGSSNIFSMAWFKNQWFNVDSGQTGWMVDGTNTAGIITSRFEAAFNCHNGGTMIRFMNNAVSYDSVQYSIYGETTTGAACIGIDVDSGSTFFGSGHIDVQNGSTTSDIDGLYEIRFTRNQPGTGTPEALFPSTNQTLAVRSGINVGSYGTYIHPDLSTGGGFKQGIGHNLYYNGTNWTALGTGVSNHGAGLFFDTVNSCIYVSPTTSGSTAAISNATLDSYARLCISSSGVRFGNIASAGTNITFHLSGTDTPDFDTVNANTCTDRTFTLTGAVSTDSYSVTASAAPTAGIIFGVFGGSASAPVVRACNVTTGNIALETVTLRVDAWRH